jgi:hypothetical protein
MFGSDNSSVSGTHDRTSFYWYEASTVVIIWIVFWRNPLSGSSGQMWPLPSRWRQHIPLKHWWPRTRLHGVITKKTTIQQSRIFLDPVIDN